MTPEHKTNTKDTGKSSFSPLKLEDLNMTEKEMEGFLAASRTAFGFPPGETPEIPPNG